MRFSHNAPSDPFCIYNGRIRSSLVVLQKKKSEKKKDFIEHKNYIVYGVFLFLLERNAPF